MIAPRKAFCVAIGHGGNLVNTSGMKKTIYDPRYRKLTDWLRQKRLEKGVTMRSLASQWECGYSFISKYEKNQVRLDVLQYFEICTLLEIDPSEGLTALSHD